MTTTTVYSSTADGYISASSTTYSTARAMGAGLSVQNALTNITTGQVRSGSTRICYEGFLSFDTSTIGSDTVSSAILSIYGVSDFSTTDFTINVAIDDWPATLASGDEVAGATLSGLTVLATLDTSGFTTSAYNAFTEVSSGLSDNIDGAGVTGLILYSSRQAAGNDPSGLEYVNYSAADTSGDTQDPKLTIEHAGAGGGYTPRLGLLGVG